MIRDTIIDLGEQAGFSTLGVAHDCAGRRCPDLHALYLAGRTAERGRGSQSLRRAGTRNWKAAGPLHRLLPEENRYAVMASSGDFHPHFTAGHGGG